MASFVAWQGPGRIDGQRVVVIVTGVGKNKSDRSRNPKTGEMAQVWYLLADVSPVEAINIGEDAGICGSCPLRGLLEQRDDGSTVNRFRSCYVKVSNAPRAIWSAWQAGQIPDLPADYVWRDQGTRLGAYGDPCVVPFAVNRDLVRRGNGNRTGYSHQWRDRRFAPMRSLVMASCETLADVTRAQALGWRTFRSMPDLESIDTSREILCPASAEAGHRRTCDTCNACYGAGSGRSIAIVAHGSPATLGSYRRAYAGLIAEGGDHYAK